MGSAVLALANAPEPAKGCAEQPHQKQPGCVDRTLHKARKTTVLSAKREVSQRQADLSNAMKKGDPERVDQGREQLARARKALQQAVDDLDR
ncbi:DUF1090 family protein [Pseudomonas typographi]|nr:DUF1090 family protein [Pseudomonas typographi]